MKASEREKQETGKIHATIHVCIQSRNNEKQNVKYMLKNICQADG